MEAPDGQGLEDRAWGDRVWGTGPGGQGLSDQGCSFKEAAGLQSVQWAVRESITAAIQLWINSCGNKQL